MKTARPGKDCPDRQAKHPVFYLAFICSATHEEVPHAGQQWWTKYSWLKDRDVTEDGALALASESLLGLPSLQTFAWSHERYEKDYEAFFTKRVVQAIVSLSPQQWINSGNRLGEVHYTRARSHTVMGVPEPNKCKS